MAPTRATALALAAVMAVAALAIDAPFARAEERAEARKLLAAGDRHLERGDRHTARAERHTARAERFAERNREERAAAEHERAAAEREQAAAAYGLGLAAYQRAYELVPTAQIFLPIGQAQEKLGQHLEAIGSYRRLLDEAEELDDTLRAVVENRIDEVMAHVVALILVIEPEGAEVTVNGEVVGYAPMLEPVFVAPGEVIVAVTADGYSPAEIAETYEAGAVADHLITLERIPVVVQRPKPRPRPPEPEPEPTASKTKLMIGAGATGALAATAMITGLVAMSRHGTFRDDTLPADEREAARDSGKSYAAVTDLLWVAAIGAGAYTAWHYYKEYLPEKRALEAERQGRRGAASRLWIAPYAHSQGGGLAAGGRF